VSVSVTSNVKALHKAKAEASSFRPTSVVGKICERPVYNRVLPSLAAIRVWTEHATAKRYCRYCSHTHARCTLQCTLVISRVAEKLHNCKETRARLHSRPSPSPFNERVSDNNALKLPEPAAHGDHIAGVAARSLAEVVREPDEHSGSGWCLNSKRKRAVGRQRPHTARRVRRPEPEEA
jgi:hypothetical protein